MTDQQRPRAAGLEGWPEGPGARTRPLTKPVRQAEQRPTPRWVGWLLIALPTLALLGSWLAGRLPLLEVVVLVLFIVAAWDWHRFQDRSRTLRAAYVGFAFLISGLVALALWRPPTGPAVAELINIAYGFAVAVSLVQLYRGSETVLTLARGWMYLIALLTLIIAFQRLTDSPVPLSGPLPTPQHLATATVVGLALMPLGHALEHDRRLRWTYPLAAAAALFVLWSTHQAVAVATAAVILAVWTATYRPGRWIVVGAAAAAGLIAASSLRRYFPLAWHDAGLTAGPTWTTRGDLVAAGMALLRDTWFLGGGPASYASAAGHAPGGPDLGSGPLAPYCLLVEIASEYGLAVTVVVLLAGLGLLHWCVQRLVRTTGRPWSSPDRAPAIWLGLLLLGLPVIGLIQATWLAVPLTGLIIGTLALLARHTEEPQGRRVRVGGEALAEIADTPSWSDLDRRLRSDPAAGAGPARGAEE